jgi:hypothetical protein
MKKIFLLSLILSVSLNTYSQKIIEDKVTVKETRLPMEPLDASIEHYMFTVSTPYAVNNDGVIEAAKRRHQEALDAYPETIEEAKRKYEEDLANYDYDVEMARENFKLESEEFNKMSAVERLAMSDQKPRLKLPRKPYYREPSKPVYYEPNVSNSIVFDPEALANVNLKLEGYTRGEENAFVGDVKIYDFQSQEPERKVEETSKYNSKTGQKEVKRVITYETQIKRPAHLQLTVAGAELYNEIFETSGEYKTLKTKSKPNLFAEEKNSVEAVLVEINEYINSQYGYSEMEREFVVACVKNKDGEYDDLEDASSYLKAGLSNFSYNDIDNNSDLLEGIALYEKALSEADLDDKKARINEKVGQAIMFTLTNVYLATYDVTKAKDLIDKLKATKLNFQEKNNLEYLEELHNERKVRAEANL